MKSVIFDYNNVLKFVNEKEIKEYDSKASLALKQLIEKTGKGNDFVGWVGYPMEIQENELEAINEAAKEIRDLSKTLVVIGIGGSYLGAKALIELLTPYYHNNGFNVIFLGNNMSPTYLHETLEYLKTVDFTVNVISKSGKTLEPAIAFRLVKNLLIEKYGSDYNKYIFATTSKENSILNEEAKREGFRTFYIPASIGGRYSVITVVGLLPLAACGYNVYDFLKGLINANQELTTLPFAENPALKYAAIRNILYNKKYTLEIFPSFEPKMHYFGEWLKQLFGESEGKDHKGIFPVNLIYSTDLHSVGQYIQDGMRNLFETYIDVQKERHAMKITKDEKNLDGLNYLADKDVKFVKDQALAGTIEAHVSGGVPVLKITIKDLSMESLGELIYFFMLSCGVSGYLLDVNPFNQEGVEAYKKNMYSLLKK